MRQTRARVSNKERERPQLEEGIEECFPSNFEFFKESSLDVFPPEIKELTEIFLQ